MMVCIFYCLGLFIGLVLGKLIFCRPPSGTLHIKQSAQDESPRLFLELEDFDELNGQRKVVFIVSKQVEHPPK